MQQKIALKSLLNNASCIGVVTVPQRQIDYSTMCTPIQNPLTDLITRVAKVQPVNLT